MSDNTTYPKPPGGWVCFHCGEMLFTASEATLHFGPRPWARAACTMTSPEVLKELRLREAQLAMFSDDRLKGMGMKHKEVEGDEPTLED